MSEEERVGQYHNLWGKCFDEDACEKGHLKPETIYCMWLPLSLSNFFGGHFTAHSWVKKTT